MLERVGGEFMNSKPHAFGDLGSQTHWWPVKRELFAFARRAGPQFFRNQLRNVKSGQRIAGDGNLNPRKSADPAVEMIGEIVDRFAVLRRAPNDRSNDCQRVANTVLQFGEQPLLTIERKLERRYVPSNAANAPHPALLIYHREYVAAQPAKISVFGEYDPVFKADPFAAACAGNAIERLGPILRHDQVGPCQQ